MKENLTKLEKIDSLREDGMVLVEKIEVLLKLLINHIDGQEDIDPVLDIILEKTEATSKIFEEIEMIC